MTSDDRGQTVADHVGACRCPGTPHALGETVRFAPAVSLAMGSAAMAARIGVTDVNEYVGLLAPIYLRFGIVGWSCLDEKGKPLPVNADTIAERFPWSDGGADLSEFADALYSGDILRPLLKRITQSSRAMPTEPSTSPNLPDGPTPPSPSAPSSPEPSADTSPSGVPV